LAKASGVSQVTISFIEAGLLNPDKITRQKLAKPLGVEPEILFPVKARDDLLNPLGLDG